MGTQQQVQILANGPRNLIVRIASLFDSNVDQSLWKAIDVTTLPTYPGLANVTGLAFLEVKYSTVGGVAVQLFWEAAAGNAYIMAFPPNLSSGQIFTGIGPVTNNAGPTATGSILVSTQDAVPGASYDIELRLRKTYGNAS